MEKTEFVICEPEIPLSLVENIKPESVSRFLPHRKGDEVECKLWQILPCTFRFFFGGRIIFGPGRPYWIYIAVILLAVATCFVIFDVLPYTGSWVAIFNGLFVLSMVSIAVFNLLTVVSKDPGYLFPHWFSNQTREVLQDETLTFSEITAEYGYTAYCCICKIFQLPDTFHCEECHACIDAGDHHCTLLGTCVGRRNYRAFFIFVVATDFALWFATIVSLTHLVEGWISEGAVHALSNAVTLYLILSTLILPPGGMYIISALPFYHLRLIYLGITLEQERSINPSDINSVGLPWNEKVLRLWINFYNRIIETPPPSHIPSKILQLKVRMRAIPRTMEVNKYHLNLQGVQSPRRIKIVFSSPWMERLFSWQRMSLIKRDIDTYGSLAVLPEDLLQIRENRRKQRRKDQTNKWRQSRMNQKPTPKFKLSEILPRSNKVGDVPTNGMLKCVPVPSPRKTSEELIMIHEDASIVVDETLIE